MKINLSAVTGTCTRLEAYTSFTVLNSSLDARDTTSSGSVSSEVVDSESSDSLSESADFALVSFSKSCSRCPTVRGCADVWRVGFSGGAREQAHFEAGREATCMATTALTISMNCCALFNVTICSDDGRFGLLGGVLGCAWDNGAPV